MRTHTFTLKIRELSHLCTDRSKARGAHTDTTDYNTIICSLTSRAASLTWSPTCPNMWCSQLSSNYFFSQLDGSESDVRFLLHSHGLTGSSQRILRYCVRVKKAECLCMTKPAVHIKHRLVGSVWFSFSRNKRRNPRYNSLHSKTWKTDLGRGLSKAALTF